MKIMKMCLIISIVTNWVYIGIESRLFRIETLDSNDKRYSHLKPIIAGSTQLVHYMIMLDSF